ncbi:MAG TPA: alpha/beta hydrolase [Gemmatimonadaceae bacterium]|nr:alpha/beta hydrolase [Gemmatimonadaceae bacterium]
MSFITARDGTQLYWREWGNGAPIVFLNPLGVGSQMWDYQFIAFAEQGFRCIGFDRRGHGRSDQPPCGYDTDTFADDVATFLDTLDLDRVTLLGHSMAAGEIVRYLSRHGGDRVARIVLLAPMTPKLLDTPERSFEPVWAQWSEDYPKWVADATMPFFVPETSTAMMRWFVSILQEVSLPVALACSRTMIAEDFRDEMRRIDVPTLIVHGDRDRSAPIERTGIPSAALIPGCRFVIYEGAPHGLMYTHRPRLHADILQFINET